MSTEDDFLEGLGLGGDDTDDNTPETPEATEPAPTPAPKAKAPAKKKPAPAKPTAVAAPKEKSPAEYMEEYVLVTLEPHKEIPPAGLFVSVNGVGIEIPPGRDVKIRRKYLEAMRNASVRTPIIEDEGKIVGYSDRRRFNFSYRECGQK